MTVAFVGAVAVAILFGVRWRQATAEVEELLVELAEIRQEFLDQRRRYEEAIGRFRLQVAILEKEGGMPVDPGGIVSPEGIRSPEEES